MMNDKDVLLRLLQHVYRDVSLTPTVRKEYEKLVVRFEEDGFEQIFPFETLNEEQAESLQTLQKHGYIETSLRYHGSGDGHVLHVNLRSWNFLELAKMLDRSVIPGVHNLEDETLDY